MRKAYLKAARERLTEMRRQVLKDDGMDTYDLASEERDREISFILTDRERDKLQAIQDAIERIEAGTYGTCESCDADIAEGRLTALPFTRLCVTCQGEREKEAKSTRRYDDERTYRKLGATDVDEENP